MKPAIALVALLLLSACGTPMPMERSPDYEAGFGDGCASASATTGGRPSEPRRNEALYRANADYRRGWNSGAAQCRDQGPNTRL